MLNSNRRSAQYDTIPGPEFNAYCSKICHAIDVMNGTIATNDVTKISAAIQEVINSIDQNVFLPNEPFSHPIFLSNIVQLLKTKDVTICPHVALMLARILYFTTKFKSLLPTGFVELLLELFSEFPPEGNINFVKLLLNYTGEFVDKSEAEPFRPFIPILLNSFSSRDVTMYDLIFLRNIRGCCYPSPNDEEQTAIFHSYIDFLMTLAFTDGDLEFRTVALWTLSDLFYDRGISVTHQSENDHFNDYIEHLNVVPPQLIPPITHILRNYIINSRSYMDDGTLSTTYCKQIPIDFFIQTLSSEDDQQIYESLSLLTEVCRIIPLDLFQKPEYYQFLIHTIPDAPYKIKYSAILGLCTLFGRLPKEKLILFNDSGELDSPKNPEDIEHNFILVEVFNILFPEVSDGQDEKLGYLVLYVCSIIRNKMDMLGYHDLYQSIFDDCGGQEILDSFAESETDEIRSALEFYENDLDLRGFVENMEELQRRKIVLEQELGISNTN